MARWDLFVGMTVLLVLVMLGLSRATQAALFSPDASAQPAAEAGGRGDERSGTVGSLSGSMDTGTLLVNVAISHGLLGTLLLLTFWYAELPLGALGTVASPEAAGLGVALGVALYLGNEGAARLADRSGLQYDERLRELLAPRGPAGWVVLLAVVLPFVATVEELLFRGALIGVVAAGYGVPAWALAVVSSALFGVGHGLQGPAGILVTGTLGLVLAAAFVATDSLLLVVIAHYVVNALEFVVHEGWGIV